MQKKKTQQKRPQAPKSDFFTMLCRSDLKVECIKEHKFHPIRKWRFDYAIPEHKIALEVEGGVWTGGRHTSPKGVSQRYGKIQHGNRNGLESPAHHS